VNLVIQGKPTEAPFLRLHIQIFAVQANLISPIY